MRHYLILRSSGVVNPRDLSLEDAIIAFSRPDRASALEEFQKFLTLIGSEQPGFWGCARLIAEPKRLHERRRSLAPCEVLPDLYEWCERTGREYPQE